MPRAALRSTAGVGAPRLRDRRPGRDHRGEAARDHHREAARRRARGARRSNPLQRATVAACNRCCCNGPPRPRRPPRRPRLRRPTPPRPASRSRRSPPQRSPRTPPPAPAIAPFRAPPADAAVAAAVAEIVKPAAELGGVDADARDREPAAANPRARLSDPELQAAAEAIAKRIPRMTDPEVSLDIPPPADIEPARASAPRARRIRTSGPRSITATRSRSCSAKAGWASSTSPATRSSTRRSRSRCCAPRWRKDREILERFLQEAKAASSIGNPHIIDISDFGDLPDGSTYFVMEYLEGKSLGELVESRARASRSTRICHIARQIADGLAAAHERGHRSPRSQARQHLPHPRADPIRTSSRSSTSASPRSPAASNTKLTRAGAVFGTPHYMSPEQAAGAPVDHRTDIYALGVMLYELASGQLPFDADNFMGILTQHMYKAPVPIRALVPQPRRARPGSRRSILKCLSKKPEQRYQSMDELAADLERDRARRRARRGRRDDGALGRLQRAGRLLQAARNAMVPATPPAPQKKWSRVRVDRRRRGRGRPRHDDPR